MVLGAQLRGLREAAGITRSDAAYAVRVGLQPRTTRSPSRPGAGPSTCPRTCAGAPRCARSGSGSWTGCTRRRCGTILRFAEAELPHVVYVEHMAGALHLDGLAEVELYSRAMDRLMVDAETPDRSRQLVAKIIAEL